MTSKLIGIVALSAALVPGIGNAIGLGEITLQSRIGEALRAELPILGQEGDHPVTACFSLAPMPGSDLPVITAAKTRVVRRGQTYILQILGSKPISEPIFAIAVQAGCGHDVMRDFILVPEAPLMLTAASSLVEPLPAASARNSAWRAQQGETIDDIADALAPQSLAERQRLLAAIKRANPELSAEMPLAEGTAVRIPKRNRGTRTEQAGTSRPAQAAASDLPPKKPAPSRAKARSLPSSGDQDRLRLGAAPDETRPTPKSSAAWQSQAATEERLLKLETTLHLLTQEVEKMDQALELATKALEAQSKLSRAEMPAPTRQPEAPAIVAPPPPTHAPQGPNWLELLISAALGAAISIGLAQYLGQRRQAPVPDLPPRHAPSAPPPPPAAEATPVASTTPAKPASASPAGQNTAPPTPGVLDITQAMASPQTNTLPAPALPEEPPAIPAEPAIVDITTEDEYSVLELADIMLAFGRVRGAADTLAEYVEQNLPKSIQPWSMLLDLYRRGGMREEFEALAARMHQRFNASTPAWSDSTTPISGLKTLEDYPHIIQKASVDWGSQACLDYLFGLISDTRAGQRNGFPLEVVEEIVLLMRILEDGYDRKRAA